VRPDWAPSILSKAFSGKPNEQALKIQPNQIAAPLRRRDQAKVPKNV